MEGVDRLHWNLARGLYGLSAFCAVMGMVCNTIIFLTTIKTRTMRATYNILIAICALADVFHQFGTLVQLPFLFDHFMVIDSKLCASILFLPEMGIGIGVICIMGIGFDRMISVLFTTRYRVLNKNHYHIFLGSIIIVYCTYLCILMISFYEKRLVLCQIMAPYPNEGATWFTMGNFTVNIVSATVYFITWLGLRSHSDMKAMKRIIKALFIIVAVDVSGWFLTPGLIELSQHLNFEPQQKLVFIYFSTIFINLALAVKLFIYYSTSSEYRAALRTFIFRNLSKPALTSTFETKSVHTTTM